MDNIQPTLTETGWGTKWWGLNGLLHRTDGPAVEWQNGNKSWYLDGNRLPFDEWLDWTPGLTDEEKVMLKLQYG